MTVAVFDMEAMLEFYKKMFLIEFEELEMYGNKLYSGRLGSLKFLFCPAELAQNTAKQNRHQLDIIVNNLEDTVQKLAASGGKPMGELPQDENVKQIGVYDPDGNSITLKENLS